MSFNVKELRRAPADLNAVERFALRLVICALALYGLALLLAVVGMVAALVL